MTGAPGLYWLVEDEHWRNRAKSCIRDGKICWADGVALSNFRLDLSKTNALDALVDPADGPHADDAKSNEVVRLAILGSSTTAHLHSSIRVGGMRRGIRIATFEPAYGQFYQDLLDPTSALHAFNPNVVIFSFDARHLTRRVNDETNAEKMHADLNSALSEIRGMWKLARAAFGCSILQQTGMDIFPDILGQAEHRLPSSRRSAITALNQGIRLMADEEGVDVLSLDRQASRDGLSNWYSPSLWYRTKQEILPTAAPVYGDLVARVVAAQRGLSKKCLVLDLDNTLWGGVIGDDGLSGITIGQGSGEGEAFLAFQEFALGLSRRGVILAVSSKNDEKNALEAFESHPEMALRSSHFACFQANWDDKFRNIEFIANSLRIGLDSIVFVDDNPFERSLVREKLPMVTVPEFPADPADLPRVLSDGGFFEGINITSEDRARSEQYQLNSARQMLLSQSADLDSYLASLDMRLIWKYLDEIGVKRAAQLINKTNQFNLTTKRYSESEVLALTKARDTFALQFRLTDKFGDNGIIAIIIGHVIAEGHVEIDTWLMSCRVLGRRVEHACLNLVVEAAKALGANRIIGKYVPSPKNGMVERHYERLGFTQIESDPSPTTFWSLSLQDYLDAPSDIQTVKE